MKKRCTIQSGHVSSECAPFPLKRRPCCTPPTDESLQLRAVVGMTTFAYSRIPALSLYHTRHRMSRAPAEFTEKSSSPLRGRSLRSLPRLRYAHAPRRCASRSPAGGPPAMGCGVPAQSRACARARVRFCPRPCLWCGGLRSCGGFAVGARALRVRLRRLSITVYVGGCPRAR